MYCRHRRRGQAGGTGVRDILQVLGGCEHRKLATSANRGDKEDTLITLRNEFRPIVDREKEVAGMNEVEGVLPVCPFLLHIVDLELDIRRYPTMLLILTPMYVKVMHTSQVGSQQYPRL